MNNKFEANYHTHTLRCRHAGGTVEDYVTKAEELGMKTLGMSDHTPLPDNWWSGIRMDISELPEYSAEVDTAKEKHPALHILKAAECDYYDYYENFFRDELLGRYKFDYLIGSVHSIMFNGEAFNLYHCPTPLEAPYYKAYVKQFIEAMESGLFAFMAHPDLFGIKLPDWTDEADKYIREMLEAAASLHMPLELNVSGYLKESRFGFLPYPRENFWEIASEYDINVIMNTDAHSPEQLNSYIDKGFEIIEKYNLKLLTELSL